MSLLPERKKSAEEIAKLRESFGLPDSPIAPIAPAPSAEPSQPKSSQPEPKPAEPSKILTAEPAIPSPSPLTEPSAPKPVRSLRRSERMPPLNPSQKRDSSFSKIPAHRHSDQELQELRKQQFLANNHAPKANPLTFIAHPALYIPAYVLLIASAVTCFIYSLAIAIPASCIAAAIAIAAYIFFCKSYSRHHTAIITLIAFFIILFAAFHYFPEISLYTP